MASRSDSISETEDIKSYRRDVIHVFNSYYATLSSLIKGETLKSFADNAFSKRLISSSVMEFSSVFDQFKAGLELCRNRLEIHQQCKCITDILLDLGGPVNVAGKGIERKLTMLQKCRDPLLSVPLSEEVTRKLYTEEVISKETSNEVAKCGGSLADVLLKALCGSTVSEGHNLLQKFASILLELEDTVCVAKDILNECPVHVQVRLANQKDFDEMEADFGDLIDTVKPLIEKSIPSLQELKKYLGTLYQGLISQLNEAESFDDVMNIVREKCTIIGVVCLKRVVNKFDIAEAKQHIEDFETTVNEFCKKVRLNICDRRSFRNSSSSLLKCDTIEFVLKWAPNEYSLSHIKHLLEKLLKT